MKPTLPPLFKKSQKHLNRCKKNNYKYKFRIKYYEKLIENIKTTKILLVRYTIIEVDIIRFIILQI